jgi:hypothetical protein
MRNFRYTILFLLAGFSSQLYAQGASATVSGSVVDSSHAVVQGATVTLERGSTGVKSTTITNNAGLFVLPPVPPGNYQLTVSANGFSPWHETRLVLEVGEQKTVEAVLPVGSVIQTVSVTDVAPELNTETADRGIVTETELVENIPLDVRNPFQEQIFTPGVTQADTSLSSPAGTNLTTQSTTNTFYINGSKAGESEILIDGAADTVFYDTHAAGAIPTLDAVREFRIYTDAYAPEFGHTGGGVASYSIKSGTNDLHGGGWYYYRNQSMDARVYGATSQPSFGRNQFGAQIGGPVVLPKLYHGRDRTFFFGSYEEMLDSTPYNNGAGLTTTVPTAAEKTGDFSQSTAWVLYDPATTTSVAAGGTYKCPDGKTYTATAAGYYRCPMYYSGKYNVIPPSEINATAQALLGMYPGPNRTPTLAGSDENNYQSLAPNEDHDYYYDVRVDHKFNDKHSIFGHIDYFNHYIYYGPVFGNPSLTPTNSNDLVPGRNYIVDHTWVISPKLIFDHHLSYAHMESHRGSVSPLGTAAFDIPSSAAPGITATFTPQIEATTNQLGEIGNSEPYERNPNSVYQYSAGFSLLEGRHTFKFGADLRRYPDQLWDPQLLTVNTSRTFTGGPNAISEAGNSGNAIADLLVGQATVTSGFAPKVNFRHQYYAFYGEDVARFTPKLTVTYGVRYNLEGADVANGNLLTFLDTTDTSPIASQTAANNFFNPLNLVGGVGVVGQNGVGRSLQIPGKLHFEPRLGIAYALNSKTVIHAGGGIFWHATPTWQTNPASYGSTRKSTSIDAAANGVTPTYTLSNPFPNGLPAPYGNNPSPLAGNNTGSGPLSIELGQNISGNPRSQQVAYQENWSLDVQRELPGHFVLTAVYAGSAGVHLYGALQLDQLSDAALATGSALTAVVPNPFYGAITDSSSVLSHSTVEAGLLQRPYPQFTGFEELNAGYGHSNYEAGQFTVEHRLNQGLSMLVAYTWSKSIDNVAESGTSATVQDNGCLRCERSVADLDQTNVVRVSSIYQLPIGPEKPLINHGALSYFLGGWEIGGTYQFNTGQPLQLTSPLRLSALDGENVMRPTLVANQSITEKVTNPTTHQLSSFNPAAFTETGVYNFGNAPRYLSNVRYPAYVDLDAFIKKTTKINERMSATFRFEALNALNNVVFGAPDVGVTDSNFGYNANVQQNNPRYCQLSGRFTF